MKKVLLLTLVLALAVFAVMPSLAIENDDASIQNVGFDVFDVAVAGYMFICEQQEQTQADMNSDSAATYVRITNSIPLYDIDNNIVAYYITYSTNCYAVINNNSDNPAVIEFGDGVQQYIENAMGSSSRVIYNNPVCVYSQDNIEEFSENTLDEMLGLYDYYPDLTESNEALVAQIESFEETVSRPSVSTLSDSDWGFTVIGSMPTGVYTSDTIPSATSVVWAYTGEFSSIASDHCGPVAITNLALYFTKVGYSNLTINSSKWDTFVAVHAITGNGPTSAITNYAKTYFSNRGYTLKNANAVGESGITTAITNDRPLGILLADGVTNWHWVVGVGWRKYTSSGDFYIRINNGWNSNANTFYKVGTGSLMWTATSYWVQ